MQQILYGLLGYIIILIAWGVICLIGYVISLIIKSNKPIQFISGLTQIIIYIFYFVFGLYLVYFGFHLLFTGQILWLIIYLVIGAGLISSTISLIITPFNIIPVLFAEHVRHLSEENAVESAEILDSNGKVVGTIDSDFTAYRKIAIYFFICYGMHIYLASNRSNLLAPGWIYTAILFPFWGVLVGSIITGLIVSIYNKIRHGSFFLSNKLAFFAKTLKAYLIVIICIQVLTFFRTGSLNGTSGLNSTNQNGTSSVEKLNSAELDKYSQVLAKAQDQLLSDDDLSPLRSALNSYISRTGNYLTKNDIDTFTKMSQDSDNYQYELMQSMLFSWDKKQYYTTNEFDLLFKQLQSEGNRKSGLLENDKKRIQAAALNQSFETDENGNKYELSRDIILANMDKTEISRKNNLKIIELMNEFVK